MQVQIARLVCKYLAVAPMMALLQLSEQIQGLLYFLALEPAEQILRLITT